MVTVDGQSTPILDAPISVDHMGDGADDVEAREYLVRVDWIKTLPREQAIWEKGMFANQNSVARLRSSFTLERLIDRLELSDDESE